LTASAWWRSSTCCQKYKQTHQRNNEIFCHCVEDLLMLSHIDNFIFDNIVEILCMLSKISCTSEDYWMELFVYHFENLVGWSSNLMYWHHLLPRWYDSNVPFQEVLYYFLGTYTIQNNQFNQTNFKKDKNDKQKHKTSHWACQFVYTEFW